MASPALNNRNGYQTNLEPPYTKFTDSAVRKDYSKSLQRETSTPAILTNSQSTMNRIAGNSFDYHETTFDRSLNRARSRSFKISGKAVECKVLMLDGTEQLFSIDRNSLGSQLFQVVCQHLQLNERDYFGLTFKCLPRAAVSIWLKDDEKISKQLEKAPWSFELQVKFYPQRPHELKDDVTRYFLCLQIRQDLISGQLPCSFNTYALLGAYVIQFEAGDFDPNLHDSTKYIQNVPFAPKDQQTPELLLRIQELHSYLFGRSPEEANRLFLENASKMALYGVRLHRATNELGEDILLGVYHGGILVYLGRLRKHRFSWLRVVSMSRKDKDFLLVVRPPAIGDILHGTLARTLRTASSSANRIGVRDQSRSERATIKDKTLTFRCADVTLAKRLFEAATEHHAFFRLRESTAPRRINLLPAFDTRKYHYGGTSPIANGDVSFFGEERYGTDYIRRNPAQFRQDMYDKQTVKLTTPSFARKLIQETAPYASLEDTDEQTRQRSLDVQDSSMSECYSTTADIKHIKDFFEETNTDTLVRAKVKTMEQDTPAPISNTANEIQTLQSVDTTERNFKNQPILESDLSVVPSIKENVRPQLETPIIWSSNYAVNSVSKQGSNRPVLGAEHWQMSPADCTQGLGMDLYGTDVATMLNAGWQGCRANRGLEGPGAYFYEVVVLEDGQVRLGWATNSASLLLGSDDEGFAYGSDDRDEVESQANVSTNGRYFSGNRSQLMGYPVVESDVIGCLLVIQNVEGGYGLIGKMFWIHNGVQIPSDNQAQLVIPSTLITEKAIFPSASLRDSRVAFNFGEHPFLHPPDGRFDWMSPIQCPAERLLKNVNCGWRINQFDTTSTTELEVSEDGRTIQTALTNNWNGFRANKGVFGSGQFYYEAEKVENSGQARFGWALAEASLILGLDNKGYAFGVDADGEDGRKIFNNISEMYAGKCVLRAGDVIGCYLDLDHGIMKWSVNEELLPVAYRIDSTFIRHPNTIFYPAASLRDTTLEVNYGDRPFKFQPSEEWYPLFASTEECVQESKLWPKDINTALKTNVNTERVESEVINSGVKITVPKKCRPQTIPAQTDTDTESNSPLLESEDTVIYATETEINAASPSFRDNDEPIKREIAQDGLCTEVDGCADAGEHVGKQTFQDSEQNMKIIDIDRCAAEPHNSTIIRVKNTFKNAENMHRPESMESWNEDEELSQAIRYTTQLNDQTMVVSSATRILADELISSSHKRDA